MTWIKFTRDYRYSDVRITEYFKEGDHVNRPRHVANAAVDDGAAIKEVKTLAQQRQDKDSISAANSGE